MLYNASAKLARETNEDQEARELLETAYARLTELKKLKSTLANEGFSEIPGVSDLLATKISATRNQITKLESRPTVVVDGFTQHALNQLLVASVSNPSGRPKLRHYRNTELARLFNVSRNQIANWLRGKGAVPKGFREGVEAGDGIRLQEIAAEYKHCRECRRDAMSGNCERYYD